MNERRVLFLSYDALTDPLGGSQILPYVTRLAALGHRITVLSLEKRAASSAERIQVRDQCAAAGVIWRPLVYREQVPIVSAVLNLVALRRQARAVLNETPHDIVHCRSYLAAIVGLQMKSRFGVRFLFDMRGFWAEERLEGGGWDRPPFGVVFRYFKRRERDFFREANAIVSLTQAARDQMAARPDGERPLGPVAVIPCCVDFNHFVLASATQREQTRDELGISTDATVVGYLGSLGGNYMLDEMLRMFVAVRNRRPGARLLMVTRSPPAEILVAALAHDISAEELVIRTATRDEVPQLISAADIGMAFKRSSFSALACSPTKLGEMLALGIPMVVNAGVGDVEVVARDNDATIIVDRFDEDALAEAAKAILAGKCERSAIRAGARRWFELGDGVAAYDAIYRMLPAVGTIGSASQERRVADGA